jgi:type IV fimbrial biogenesis protein FimT
MKRNRGFTLVELMITVIVIAVVATVAVPNFARVIESTRLTGYSSELVSAVNTARSEAIKRGSRVGVCASNDQATCSGSDDWSTGWIVYVDDGSGNVDEVLRVREAFDGDVSIDGQSGASGLTYRDTGAVLDAVGIEIDIPSCDGGTARTVSVNLAGRPEVAQGSCG